MADIVSPAQRPYTHGMVVIHRLFRREFRLLPELVGGVPAGDRDRSALLAGHARFLLTALDHHHVTEDDLLWPLLLKRAGEAAYELVHRMQAQHDAVAEEIKEINVLLPAWRSTASLDVRDRLADALRRLHGDLVRHLDDEEEQVLPVAAEHLTAAEWNEVAAGARGGGIPPAKRLTMLGGILEDATEQEREEFLKRLPAPARSLWGLAGRRRYEKETRRIRG